MVKSRAQTMMGLDADLKEAAAALQRCNPTAISLKAGCALFLRYTTRSSALEDEDFASAKARIIEVVAHAQLSAPRGCLWYHCKPRHYTWTSSMSSTTLRLRCRQ